MNFPSVTDFYDGKSVFLTGSSGYLGVVLLEELLRICSGIRSIYILLRPKKGVDPESRLEKIFEQKIFGEMIQSQPELLKKVHIITGDLAEPNLGLSEEDIKTILDEVSIVFHVAASISFVEPLKSMLKLNLRSTHSLVEICRKMNKCDAFVYCSSSSANSNRFDIESEEEIYRLPFPAEKFLSLLLSNATSEELEQLHAQCHPPWPNTYSFSKHLTENYLVENASDLPLAIIRPSIVAPTNEKPFRGYVEDTTGISALMVGIVKGVIKTFMVDPENEFDTVPVDFAAHAHIIAADRIHSDRWKFPLLVNCTSVHRLRTTDTMKTFLNLGKQQLAPFTFREPTDLKLVNNRILANILTFYEHFVPAYGIDLMLRLSGKKPKLVRIFRFIEKTIDTSTYFVTHQFRFRTEKFQKLLRELNEEDKKVFVNPEAGDFDMKHLVENAPFYDWSKDKKTPAERKLAARRNQLLTDLSKAIFLILVGGFIFFLSWILKIVLF